MYPTYCHDRPQSAVHSNPACPTDTLRAPPKTEPQQPGIPGATITYYLCDFGPQFSHLIVQNIFWKKKITYLCSLFPHEEIIKRFTTDTCRAL